MCNSKGKSWNLTLDSSFSASSTSGDVKSIGIDVRNLKSITLKHILAISRIFSFVSKQRQVWILLRYLEQSTKREIENRNFHVFSYFFINPEFWWQKIWILEMNFKIDKIVFLDMFLSINHGIPLKIVTRYQFLTENQNNNKKSLNLHRQQNGDPISSCSTEKSYCDTSST